MRAQELRIGNWVKTCIPNMKVMIPCMEAKVQGITIFHEVMFNHEVGMEGFDMPSQHLMGIKLTEEWLLRFGFEKTFENKEYKVYSIGFNTIAFGVNDITDCELTRKKAKLSSDYIVNTQIEYIHQLQNIWFCLTGTELLRQE